CRSYSSPHYFPITCVFCEVQVNHGANNDDQQWEDIVRRLGGNEDEAKAEPILEDSPDTDQPLKPDQPLQRSGPRDYALAAQEPESLQPPEPQSVSTGKPRSLLSWTGVIIATLLWLFAGLGGRTLPSLLLPA